ncbi:MAG: hypothetical protein L0Y57_06670 [Beijerinckiaceae bacterium]|nr:hypothetical protein [Beijerinckiaceae bacterium]
MYGMYYSVVTLNSRGRRMGLVPGCLSSMAGKCSSTAAEKIAEAIHAATGLPVSRETVDLEIHCDWGV